jgi:hypothetical protein
MKKGTWKVVANIFFRKENLMAGRRKRDYFWNLKPSLVTAVRHNQVKCQRIRGPIFRTFFSAENSAEFLRKTILKTIFQNFFRGKFNFFPNIFWGKFSAEFYPKFSPEKMHKKLAPGELMSF